MSKVIRKKIEEAEVTYGIFEGMSKLNKKIWTVKAVMFMFLNKKEIKKIKNRRVVALSFEQTWPVSHHVIEKDITALLSEIERLTAENEVLRVERNTVVLELCGVCDALTRATGHGWVDCCANCEWDEKCTQTKTAQRGSQK